MPMSSPRYNVATKGEGVDCSMRERIWPDLEMYRHGLHSLAPFLEPRHAIAARGPQAPAFPAGVGIVDAAIEALGIEACRVWHLEGDHLAVLEGDEAVIEVACRDRNVFSEPEGVVLIYPRIV